MLLSILTTHVKYHANKSIYVPTYHNVTLILYVAYDDFLFISQEEELARITIEAEKERNKLNLAMQMEMARQKQVMKARRARKKTRKSKVMAKSPFGNNNDSKKSTRSPSDERTKNLLDEAQQLRDLLAASLRRGKDRRRKSREKSSPQKETTPTSNSGKMNLPPPPPLWSKKEETNVGVNLSSLRYLQGKFSPQKKNAWGD